MIFTPNDSPLSGREGTAIAGARLGQRLQAEAEVSVSLRVNPLPGAGEAFEVQARGELQLGLLIGTGLHPCALPMCCSLFSPSSPRLFYFSSFAPHLWGRRGRLLLLMVVCWNV